MKQPEPSKKLFAYYHTGRKYDTALDSLDVQQRRVKDWADRNKYEVVEEVHEHDAFDYLEDLFNSAYRAGGNVIVASASRIADNTMDFMNFYENPHTPLLTTDSLVDAVSKKYGTTRLVGLVEMIAMSNYEYYLDRCKEWLE